MRQTVTRSVFPFLRRMLGRASKTSIQAPANSAASLGSTIACALSAKSTTTDKASINIQPGVRSGWKLSNSPHSSESVSLDKLKEIKPGEAFDREFISAQIQGHEMLRATQEQYLKAGKDLATVTAVLKSMDPSLSPPNPPREISEAAGTIA